MYWILLILVLLIVIAILVFRSRNHIISGGYQSKELLFISYPPGHTPKIRLPKTKIIQIQKYIHNNQLNEDKLIKDLKLVKSNVAIVGLGLRTDQIKLVPTNHIHVLPFDVSMDNPFLDISKNRNMLHLSKADFDKYWDDLCHMDINKS